VAIESGAEAFIETGTFRGDSIRWVAKRYPLLSCLSCETNRVFYLWAKSQIRLKNVDIKLQDSRRFLIDTLTGNSRYRKAVFWLDAHWDMEWPLLDELRIIKGSKVDAMVFVDDFDIGVNGFGFDSYKGQVLNLDYIRGVIGDAPISFPEYKPPHDQTRGYAIVRFGKS